MALHPDHADRAIHLHWSDITVDEIKTIKDDVITKATKVVEQVTVVPLEDVTLENTVEVS